MIQLAAGRTSGMLIVLKEGPPPTPGPGTITTRAAMGGHNDAVTDNVVIDKPLGTSQNDILIASIATRGTPTVASPGWTPIRTTSGSSWTLQSFWKRAGASEPPTYTFSLTSGGTPINKAAAGTITAYIGADTSSTPIDASSGRNEATNTTSFTANEVQTTAANDLIIGAFMHTGVTDITPPGAPNELTERAEDVSNAAGQAHVRVMTADASQPSLGWTGNKAASTTTANTGAAQLIALRAAPGTGGTPSPFVTTYVTGPDGVLLIDADGTPSYPLVNGHGDIVASADSTGILTANAASDEYGKTTGTPANRLGWLGNNQRYSITNSGTIRMGVRLYDPNLGRFLSVDPIEGGSANDYDYCEADPVNCVDLDGFASEHGKKNVRHSPEELQRARDIVNNPQGHSRGEVNKAKKVLDQQKKAERQRRSRQNRDNRHRISIPEPSPGQVLLVGAALIFMAGGGGGRMMRMRMIQ